MRLQKVNSGRLDTSHTPLIMTILTIKITFQAQITMPVCHDRLTNASQSTVLLTYHLAVNFTQYNNIHVEL